MALILAVAGVAALIFAGVQATFSRPPEAFLFAGVALLVLAAFGRRMKLFRVGPSGVAFEQEVAKDVATDVAEQVTAKTQPPDLKLSISTAIPVGFAKVQMGTGRAVQLTVVNVGDKPIGVNALGLGLSGNKWTPFLHPVPFSGSERLPAILKPQETASVYHPWDGLAATLRDEGLEIETIVAQLADGTERRTPVPPDWRTLKD